MPSRQRTTALEQELSRIADAPTATFLQRFFKTGPGQYGEGDRFLGIRVPQLRGLVRRFHELPQKHVLELLRSPWHEQRLLALLLLVEQYRRGGINDRRTIYRAYLANTQYVNNWDLVDASAEYIVGPWHGPKNLRRLEVLARSGSVWERRIAMLATFHWIKQQEFRPALHVAELLLRDDHDLIHKAVGWMLREIGKRDRDVEERFLRSHHLEMSRTTLRYAIERFPEGRRQQYLRGDV
jgi:3-methyladenine DNA glycosylase AlkD